MISTNGIPVISISQSSEELVAIKALIYFANSFFDSLSGDLNLEMIIPSVKSSFTKRFKTSFPSSKNHNCSICSLLFGIPLVFVIFKLISAINFAIDIEVYTSGLFSIYSEV